MAQLQIILLAAALGIALFLAGLLFRWFAFMSARWSEKRHSGAGGPGD